MLISTVRDETATCNSAELKKLKNIFDIDYKCLPNLFNLKILAIFSLYNLLILILLNDLSF